MSGAVCPRDVWAPLPADAWERLHAKWPNGQRLLTAFLLARDVEACGDLLRGVPVDRSRLFENELVAARAGRLAVLVSPADLLEVA